MELLTTQSWTISDFHYIIIMAKRIHTCAYKQNKCINSFLLNICGEFQVIKWSLTDGCLWFMVLIWAASVCFIAHVQYLWVQQ